MASVKAVAASGNTKLGNGWGVTYRRVGQTCPPCPLLDLVCYAQRGRVNIHQTKSARLRRSADASIGALDGCSRVRWDVSGDCFDRGEVDVDYQQAKYDWHGRNLGAISLGYTHGAERLAEEGFGPESFPDGFNLLASCHGANHARKLRDQGWRTARVVPDAEAPIDDCEVYCPVDRDKHEGRKPRTDCSRCRLCWGPEHSEKNIVFIQF